MKNHRPLLLSYVKSNTTCGIYIKIYIINYICIYYYYYFLVAKKVFGVLGDMGGSYFFAVGSPDIEVLPNAETFPKHSVCLCRF